MLLEFQRIWNDRVGHINTAKHRIELLEPFTKPVHSTPYRAGPKTRKIEKVEIDKVLNESIFKHARMEWASPVVFGRKEAGTL